MGFGLGNDALVVRSYWQGDGLRKVHWRTTARRDELMVRVEGWPQLGGAIVLLDHRTAAHHGSGRHSSFEYAVSLAASVYMHLRQRGQQVRLVTADGVVRAGGPDHAERTVDTALDALAALGATDQLDLVSGPAMAGRQEMIAVLGAGDDGLVDVDAGPAQAARLLVAAGWSVVVAGPDQAPSVVWDRLCISSRSKLQVPR